MKQLLRRVCACLLVLLPAYAHAQYNMFSTEPKAFTGALIGGANFTQIDGDAFYGYHRIGLNVGGQVFAHFSPSFGASVELLYSQKGSRGQAVVNSLAIGTYVTKYFMTLNYIEVPVLLHLSGEKYDMEAGISYNYLIKSDEWILADQPIVISTDRNFFNNTDLNWVLGVSRKLYEHWFANFRFQYSIKSIRPTERVPIGYSYGNNGQFSNMICLRLVYVF